MTPVLLRFATTMALGSGALIAGYEVEAYLLPAGIVVISVAGLIFACLWRVYSRAA